MDPTPLRSFRIELGERAVILEGEDGSLIKVEAANAALLQQIMALLGSPQPAATPPAVPTSPEKTKQGTVTLTGRLKSQPKEGRPDGAGNPTAWARFATHVDGEAGPHLYSTTFHRHCAQIALDLHREDQITVVGYVRESSQAGRLDGLSVFTVPSYPGKPERDEA
jgi:hypothetical protein